MNRNATTILDMLKIGARSNLELAEVTPRYGARLFELRKEGHDIRTTRVTESLFMYGLHKS